MVGVHRVHEGCLEGIWKVTGRLEGVRKILESMKNHTSRLGKVRTGQVRSGQVRTGPIRRGHARTSQVRSSKVRTS